MSYPQPFAAAYLPSVRGIVLAGNFATSGDFTASGNSTATAGLVLGRHVSAGNPSGRFLSRLQVQYLTAVHELYADDRSGAARQPRCCR
jgi:hypothetical protein